VRVSEGFSVSFLLPSRCQFSLLPATSKGRSCNVSFPTRSHEQISAHQQAENQGQDGTFDPGAPAGENPRTCELTVYEAIRTLADAEDVILSEVPREVDADSEPQPPGQHVGDGEENAASMPTTTTLVTIAFVLARCSSAKIRTEISRATHVPRRSSEILNTTPLSSTSSTKAPAPSLARTTKTAIHTLKPVT
jgi:hypothetical protein